MTHFKETDQNVLISVDSCHHASWLKEDKKDFLLQAQELKYWLLDKGYDGNAIDSTIREVETMTGTYCWMVSIGGRVLMIPSKVPLLLHIQPSILWLKE